MRMIRFNRSLYGICLPILFLKTAADLIAQSPNRNRSTLVTIPVSVYDRSGRPITDLKQDDFQILERNERQKITSVRHEDDPLSIGLVIDNSGSMRNRRQRINSAVLAFVRESNPEDEAFIVNFGDTAYVEQQFTSSLGDLIDAFERLSPRGQTALYDAITLSADKLTKEARKDVRAILLVSDGEDNASKSKYEDALRRLQESNVTLYAIGLTEDARSGQRPSAKAKKVLQDLADATGGAAYFPKSVEEVEQLCREIAHDLRGRYTIGYEPSNAARDGAWRDVKVAVTSTKAGSRLTVRAKPGYFAK
jgi:Ca-activated chloride channel family protein